MVEKVLMRYLSIPLVLLFGVTNLIAQEEVVLNPVEISGTIILGQDNLNPATQIKTVFLSTVANGATSNDSMPIAPASNVAPYSVVVDVPVGGSLEVKLKFTIFTENSTAYSLRERTLTVFDGPSLLNQNFDLSDVGFVSGDVTVNGGDLNVAAVSVAFSSGNIDSDILSAQTSTVNGSYIMAFEPDNNARVFGTINLTSGANINIQQALGDPLIDVFSGQETIFDINVDAPPSGDLQASVELPGREEILRYSFEVRGPSNVQQVAHADTFSAPNRADFTFNDLAIGTYSIRPIAFYKDNDSAVTNQFRFPLSSFNSNFSPANQPQISQNNLSFLDISDEQAYISGKLTLSGAATNADLSGITSAIEYKSTDLAQTGLSRDNINSLSGGQYSLLVVDGDWFTRQLLLELNRASDIPDLFLRNRIVVNNFRPTAENTVNVSRGDTTVNNIDLALGAIKINARIIGGRVFTNPFVKATCENKETNGGITTTLSSVTTTARSINQIDVTEGVVNVVAPAGDCLLDVFATVDGGETVIAGDIPVSFMANVEQETDIGAPVLTVLAPTPDSVLNTNQLTVSGTSVDDIEVASVSVNSIAAVLVPNTPGDFSSVAFSVANVPLVPGANELITVTTDTSGNQASESRTVYYEILNTAPEANDQAVSSLEDDSVTITLSATDSEDDSLSYMLLDDVMHGVLIANTANSFTYTPNANYSGSDAFTFVVSDGELESSVATVSIEVGSVNDAPTANAQDLQTDKNTAVTGNVSAQDIDGDILLYTVGNPPANGAVFIDQNGAYTYTPDSGFSGSDSFTVVVSDELVDVNLPVAVTVIDTNSGDDDSDNDDSDNDDSDNDDSDNDDSDNDDSDNDDSDNDDDSNNSSNYRAKVLRECGSKTYKNHGQFVRCVAHATNNLKALGLITGKEKGKIMRAAARSDVGKHKKSKRKKIRKKNSKKKKKGKKPKKK